MTRGIAFNDATYEFLFYTESLLVFFVTFFEESNCK
jgi:hypothetical protein